MSQRVTGSILNLKYLVYITICYIIISLLIEWSYMDRGEWGGRMRIRVSARSVVLEGYRIHVAGGPECRSEAFVRVKEQANGTSGGGCPTRVERLLERASCLLRVRECRASIRRTLLRLGERTRRVR